MGSGRRDESSNWAGNAMVAKCIQKSVVMAFTSPHIFWETKRALLNKLYIMLFRAQYEQRSFGTIIQFHILSRAILTLYVLHQNNLYF